MIALRDWAAKSEERTPRTEKKPRGGVGSELPQLGSPATGMLSSPGHPANFAATTD
jgi:hypothetical protein